jgi:tetratricopeptide (TPR) repeat protein
MVDRRLTKMKRIDLGRSLATAFLISAAALSIAAQPGANGDQAAQLFNKATEQYNARQYDAAIANYTEYLKLNPNSSAAYFNRGLSLYNKAQLAPTEALYRQAAADFSKAIEIKPNDAEYWTSRGSVYIRLMTIDYERSLAQALSDLNQAIRLNPKSGAAYRERGVVYELSNQLAKALPDLNTAIRLDPKDAVAYYTRAKVHGGSNRYAAAKADAEMALKLFPSYEAAQIYRDYMNEQIAKAAAAQAAPKPKPVAKTPVRAKPAPKPSPTKPAKAAKPDPTAIAAAINDLSEAYKQTEAAAKAKDHALTIALATRSLQLLPMKTELEPSDHMMLSLFLTILDLRAEALTETGKHADADTDRKRIVDAVMDATLRYMTAANERLRKESGSGGGVIMASVEMVFAATSCRSGFDKGTKWMDSVQTTRPNDSRARMKAAISMLGLREICSNAFVMYGNITADQPGLGIQQRSKHLNDAVERYTEAISFHQSNVRAYQERAKVYRALGQAALAAADEAKVRELSAPKKN